MSFGQNISSLISNRKITKSEICIKMEISRPALDNWISEKTYPTVDYLYKLKDVLNCSIHDFFDEETREHEGLDKAFDSLKKEIVKFIDRKAK